MGKWLLRVCAIFAKQKPRNVEHESRRRLTKGTKEQSMEYLIVFSVAAMMTVYVWILARYLQHA
jgi:hypothetical protein